ncbi:MAG: copper chaperone PCu(A)C [Comamonadaceae bacterium]|nr:MAG: copper chaperone PCu(A)C [Comamonadaceae bacterium]
MQRFLLACTLACASLSLHAQGAPVTVEGAWARASVQGQSGTGAFMTLTAREPLSLVGVATPAAGVAEVHEMKMEGDVMRMRAVPAIPLAPGKPLELKPGGYHLMLMDLKAPLQPGTSLPVSLRFRDAKGVESTVQVAVPVAVRAPAGHKH